jgi:hypothetical protein
MGKPVLHGGWEEDGEDNLEQLAAFSLNIDRGRLTDGKISEEELEAIDEEAKRLEPYVRFFELPFGKDPPKTTSDDEQYRRARLTNDRQLDIIERHVRASGCATFVFDLFKAALVQLKPDDEELALRRMQAIVKSTKTHGLLVHHLRGKDVETRADKRPTRESVKGASAWIEISDTVLATHYPAMWSKKYDRHKLEIYVMKQRRWTTFEAIEIDMDPVSGRLGEGRSIAYEHPGSRDDETREGLDGFLDRPSAGERRARR